MKKHLLTASAFILFSTIATAQCAMSDSNIYPFVYNGKSYEIVMENKTWIQAAQCAAISGGKLVEINDKNENDTLFYYAGMSGLTNANTVAPDGGGASYLWIGANDMATEGNWIWDGANSGTGTQFWQGAANGSAVGGLYENWGNEPDDFQGQDAGAYALTSWPFGTSKQWNDVKDTNKLYFVIEYPGVIGIDEKTGININVFPNPAQENIFIKHDATNKVNEIKIIDVTGRLVKQQTDKLEENLIEVNVSGLNKGIYFVSVSSSQGIVTKKIIIQ